VIVQQIPGKEDRDALPEIYYQTVEGVETVEEAQRILSELYHFLSLDTRFAQIRDKSE
jgi:hypothetical protein